MLDAPPASPLDVAIIGAGPIGIEAAIRAKRAGLRYLLIDKGAVVDAIYRWPTFLTFFTTSERLEVGGHPFVTATDKPTRKEALDYYRKVAQREALHVRLYSPVTAVRRAPEGFELTLSPEHRPEERLRARTVVVATGYYDNPKRLGVPGEDLPSVSHYFDEAHPHWGRNVTIIGAGSSAADAALELFRAGAKVTMVHRGEGFRHSLKYWIRPNLENRIKEGSITAHFRTVVQAITPTEVVALKAGEELRIPTDVTFALTGYYAAPGRFLEGLGVETNPEDFSVALDPATFESNVPGLYFIGSAGFGTRTSDVFIENGLLHAAAAMADIARRLEQRPVGV
ncbi:YpdA family putative bacillithiol disulfide reductase [Truepera radiovictrix]|uniref:FAD-dependent pyridine nucleotide-disulfide oxidoreductase n=1 Tax=Truepera radiovictrix (strain DSM 17093 / CIP 108686 / LMG 22925 / RQ-24) TaxID=649638 RepID=D7CTZ7_TRURR|nr:YpdA family putative bacillithiol disulfide reductase [Truepera radiovictrix]ADI13895.1 FAD-dependent pyridine nucleotide-disulfide oxidoreductase [Truepera radiovictrix DSM 17093]WMT57541.1 YpdA family putative bacillithiol disulfide reductase [Truepera radiovictrix]